MGFSFFHVVEKETSCDKQIWLHFTSHTGQSCSQRPSYYLKDFWKFSLHQNILAEQNSIIITRVIFVPAIFHVSLPLWLFCTETFYTWLFVSKDFKKEKNAYRFSPLSCTFCSVPLEQNYALLTLMMPCVTPAAAPPPPLAVCR